MAGKEGCPRESLTSLGHDRTQAGETCTADWVRARSAALSDRLRQMKENRLTEIAQALMPIPVNGAYLVLHIIPYRTLGHAPPLDVTQFSALDVQAIGRSSEFKRFNVDGHVWFYSVLESNQGGGYVQFFRNGMIEAVDSRILWPSAPFRTDAISGENVGTKWLHSPSCERAIAEATDTYLQALATLKVEPPFFVSLTFRGVKSYRLKHPTVLEPKQIDRETLYLPEVLVERFSQSAVTLLRPVFDALWQAAGLERNQNYDARGEWVGG